MYVMFDSTDLTQIPADAAAVAAYIDGKYANYAQAKQRFPSAKVLSISTSGSHVAECFDIERGDYLPTDVPALYHLAIDAHVWRPCFYASASVNMPAVENQLQAANIARPTYRLWVAAWDNDQNVPAGYDAHQFSDSYLGRNLDCSSCLPTFFQEPISPPADWWEAKIGVNLRDGQWRVEPLPAQAS